MILMWLSWAAVITVVFSVFPMATAAEIVSDNSVICSDSDADVVFVIDTTSSNATSFLVQQHRLLRTLKRLSNVLKGRSVRYGVIGFHRTPELMLELESPFANDTLRVSNLISSLRPHQSTSNSVSRALDEAMSLFFESRSSTPRRQIIILAHDGVNTDLVAETLDAVSNVEKLGVVVFAVTGSSRPNAFALLGYAGSRDRLFVSSGDRAAFHDSLDEVDLTIVLDTSGSVFKVFEDQRTIVLDILDDIPVEAYADAVQVSVTRFAANADVILPFLKGRALSDIKDAVKEVKFTGQNTRIASAVEIALEEMERARRADARQIFVLISDGHGQEYWNVVQATGKRLQETKAELFAVSAGRDYNEAELLIYVGDESRVFVGPKYNRFLSVLSVYLKDCIFKGQAPPAVAPGRNALGIPTTEETPVETSSARKTTKVLTGTRKSLTTTSTTTEEPLVEDEQQELSVTTEGAFIEDKSRSATIEPFEDEGDDNNDDTADDDSGRFIDEQTGEELEKRRAARLRDIGQNTKSCDFDVVLMIDRSQSVENDFKKEIELAIRAVELFPESEFTSGRIRVGAVSFANDAKLEFLLGRSSRENVVRTLNEVLHTGGSTSSVAGAQLALQQLISSRRPKARLVTLLFTDGQSQDYWRELIQTSMRLRDIPNSVLLAITASEQFSQSELQVWAGESSKVFVSSEEKNFLQTISKEMRRCSKEDPVTKNGELEGLVKKQELGNTTSLRAPKAESTTVTLIGSSSTVSVEENINESRLETTSLVANADLVDSTAVDATAFKTELSTLRTTTLTERPQLIAATGSSAEPELALSEVEATSAGLEEGSGDEGSGKDGTPADERKVHGIRTANDVVKIAEGKDRGPSDPSLCLTDLMFVVDTSTSVEAEFQLQLQLAVDLIKRLPSNDFEHRIRVGVVVFNANAVTMLPMGESRTRSTVLDSLLSIRHSGGSTSVASGVNLALDEIEKDHRAGAKLMVVLMSDGNSQDHWDDVIRSSNRLRTTGADVYVVTISKKYMFRELELYAGDKLRVYIDARVRQFLDETEGAVTYCGQPVKRTTSSVVLQHPKACSSLVDLVVLLDTSTPEDDFYREKQLALDLLKALPATVFERRLAVSVIAFANETRTLTPLGVLPKDELVFDLERVSHGTGPSSLTSAAITAIAELRSRRRQGSRAIVLIVSNGSGGEDKWRNVKKSSAALRFTGAEVFAVSLAETANVQKLKAYTGNEQNLYLAEESDKFILDVGTTILSCGASASGVNNVESEDVIPEPSNNVRDRLVHFRTQAQKRCPYDKMDLQIIFDASASRREVFEHQRELALSLIERLPISAESDQVAVGISSFTSIPTLRLPLGLGKNKAALRAVIESIDYHGGSTLTAQAVDISVDDLRRGQRPDAIQVVVLMNDGFSQDEWDRVLAASERLAATKAERFGVALGDQVDYRELEHYIGRKERIYRDGSTEKFLNDVVSLLNGEKDCTGAQFIREPIQPPPRRQPALDDDCSSPNLDLIVVFDNAAKSPQRKRDSSINPNRYLLLDVLGSLKAGSHVRVSVISFDEKPKIILDFTDISERDRIFAQIETIRVISTQPSYSEAVSLALDKLRADGRADARTGLLIIGNGDSRDTSDERSAAATRIREYAGVSTAVRSSIPQTSHMTMRHVKFRELVIFGGTECTLGIMTPGVTCFAVDASRSTNIEALTSFTGSSDRVYPYERNAEFAKHINRVAKAGNDPKCNFVLRAARERVHAAAAVEVRPIKDEVYSTPFSSNVEHPIKLDLVETPLNIDKSSEKLILRKKIRLRSTKKPTTATTIADASSTSATTASTQVPDTSTTSRTTNIRTRATTVTPLTAETTPTTRLRSTTASTTTTTRPPTSPSYTLYFPRKVTEGLDEPSTTFRPGFYDFFVEHSPNIHQSQSPSPFGCLLDVIVVLDSSGSVEETFRREKELASGIVSRFRIGPNNARISIIKFAGAQQVKTVWSFADEQSRGKILRALDNLPFNSGTTAIHSALLKALSEYTADRGARPGQARPIAIVFTDGYGQKSTAEEAAMLRAVIPDTYAIAINHHFPIARPELEVIVGRPERVYTDATIGKFHALLESIAKDCIIN